MMASLEADGIDTLHGLRLDWRQLAIAWDARTFNLTRREEAPGIWAAAVFCKLGTERLQSLNLQP